MSEWTFCAAHGFAVPAGGFCGECGGDRNLIQVVAKSDMSDALDAKDREIAEMKAEYKGRLAKEFAYEGQLRDSETRALGTLIEQNAVIEQTGEMLVSLQKELETARARVAKLTDLVDLEGVVAFRAGVEAAWSQVDGEDMGNRVLRERKRRELDALRYKA